MTNSIFPRLFKMRFIKQFAWQILLLVAAAFLGISQVSAQTNLIKNGDFSTKFDWTNSSYFYSGDNITQIEALISTSEKEYYLDMGVNVHPLAVLPVIPPPLSQSIAVQPNHTYRLSFLSKGFQTNQGPRFPVFTYLAAPAWQVSFAGQTQYSNLSQPIADLFLVDWVANSMDFRVGNVTSAILSFTTSLGSVFSMLRPGCTPCQVTAQHSTLSKIQMIDLSPPGPTLTVQKALGSARVADTDQFTVQITQNSASVVNATTNSTTTGAGATVTAGTGTTGVTTLVTGTQYKITELAAGTTNLGQYSGTLSCLDAANKPKALTLNTLFTLADNDAITCTLTNTAAAAPTLTVTERAIVTAPATFNPPENFSYAGNNGWTTQQHGATKVNTLVTVSSQTLAAANLATTLTVTVPTVERGWRIASIQCTDTAAAASGNPAPPTVLASFTSNVVTSSPNYSITIPANYVVPKAALQCAVFASRQI